MRTRSTTCGTRPSTPSRNAPDQPPPPTLHRVGGVSRLGSGVCNNAPMNAVLALCPIHGSFPSRLVQVSSGSNIRMVGNGESCPKCGASSRTMEGIFNVRDGLVEILSAPGWTREALGEAAELVRRAKSAIEESPENDIDARVDELINEVKHLRGEQAEFLRQLTQGKSKERVRGALGALLAVLMWLYTAEDVREYSADVLLPLVEQALEGAPEP